MILSSPGLVPRIGVVRRAAARLGRLVAPDLRVPHGLPLHKLSHDPGVLPQVTSDRLTHALVTPRLVTFMLDDGERAIADAARCRVPTLLLVAGDDWLVRAEGSRRFHAALPAGVGSLHEYPALYHELLQERPPDRATVLGDLMAWLGGQLASARRGR
jgi:alpha-beta hydrolase superfamily lysophospholipase